MEAISNTGLGVVKKLMNQPVLIDGRNIYDEQELKKSGIDYICIGKK